MTFLAILLSGYILGGAFGAVHALLVGDPFTFLYVRNLLENLTLAFAFFLYIARPFPSFDGNPGTEWLDRIHW